MKIKLLGTIEKNKGLVDDLLSAIKELGINPELEVSGNTSDFIKYKVRAPGAIIVNGKIIFKGHQDLSGHIKKELRKEAEREGLL